MSHVDEAGFVQWTLKGASRLSQILISSYFIF